MPGTRTRTIELGPGRSVEVTLAEAGTGRTALVLHGGGGPATVQGIAAHLSGAMGMFSRRSIPAGTAPRARRGSPRSVTWPPPTCGCSGTRVTGTYWSSARPSAAGSAPRWPCATMPG